MKVLTTFGTRPEVTKLAPVIRQLGSRPAFRTGNVASGQHDDLGDAMTAPPFPATAGRSRVLLTVEVEDYFQVGRFDRLIRREQWYRFETRVERNTLKTLALLDRFGVRATFFVLGWVADHMPELITRIADAGHELATMSYDHKTIADMTPESFRDDLVRSRDALERASGRRIVGHRVPHYLGPADLWALDVLAQQGYQYDSSIKPIFRRFAREPWRRRAHQHRFGDRTLWEFPLSAWHLGLSMPIAGAGYFRHLPRPLMRQAVRRWQQKFDAPFLMYFRVWEIDPEQPRISTAPFLSRVRHYRNLDKMPAILGEYFQEYHVTGIGDFLGFDQDVRSAPLALAPAAEERAPELRSAPAPTPITVVVPCYNEKASLPYLARTLDSVVASLADRFDLRFMFVDDGSGDGTGDALREIFGGRPGCTIEGHEKNQGVAAAILTGARAATTDIVCSMDCDCTYDPHELGNMIPLLTGNVGMVTASPYHPQGVVRNVPPWRLTLSRGASFLYRRVLRQKLFTYTSCFRVYRRSAIADLRLHQGGFLGVAEMLGILDLRGTRVVEHPAVLEVRIFGRSKMKVWRAVAGHLRLLASLAALRLRGMRGLGGAAGTGKSWPVPL